MTTLDDYTDGTPPEPMDPPRFRKVSTVRNPTDTREKPGSTVLVLNRGDDEEEIRAYYSTRDEEENLFHMFDSYPISESILDRLDREGAERVYIAADEEGADGVNVYEFTLEQYLSTSNRYVWERYVEGEEVEDPQKCPSRDDALHVFENVHGSDLFRPTD
jgi:hypothetical protein